MAIAVVPDIASPSTETLLTPDDVARRLSVSRSLIYAIVKTGKLRALYIGRLPRIREADLAAYLSAAEKPRS